MAHGYRIAATYESGYVHMENDQDYSPYAPGRNTFFDILHGMPTKAGHGRLMQFSLIAEQPELDEDGQEVITRWDIDWRPLPDDALPIHYMEMKRQIVMMGSPDAVDSGPICVKRGFGFSFTDPKTGETVTQVQEIIQSPEDEPEISSTPPQAALETLEVAVAAQAAATSSQSTPEPAEA